MACKCKNMSCICDLTKDQKREQYHSAIQRMESQGLVKPETAKKLKDNADSATRG